MTPIRHAKRSRAGRIAGVALLACASVADAQEARRCEAHEIGREIVTLADGSVVYVEPRAFVTSGDVTLLAGTPSYVFGHDETGVDARGDENTIAGVILRPGQPVETLPWPLAGRHHVLRSAPRPDGGFVVVGAELSDTTFFLEADRVRGLWLAEWDDRWLGVDRLPAAPVAVNVFLASSVVATPHGWAWSFPALDPLELRAFVVFELLGDAWTTDVVETTAATAYVELFPDGRDLAATVVQQDTGPGGQPNAIALYRRRHGHRWQTDGMLQTGGGVHFLRSDARGRTLAWWEESRAVRTSLDALARSTIITIDSAASDHVLVAGPRSTLWVTHHVAEDRSRTIRLYTVEGSRARLLTETPSPYTGFMTAAAGPDGVRVAGARVSSDPADVQVASLILRYGLRCRED